MAGGWEVIIPFLKPIEALLRDPEVSDILVNGNQGVFLERAGRMERLTDVVLYDKTLQVAVRNIARTLGDEISEESPIMDARLPDGSRIAAVLPCISVPGTVLAIRKLQSKRYDANELVRVGTCPAEVLDLLRSAIDRRWNVLIAGSTGAGKTTLLNALSAFIPADERLVVIEDTAEIQAI